MKIGSVFNSWQSWNLNQRNCLAVAFAATAKVVMHQLQINIYLATQFKGRLSFNNSGRFTVYKGGRGKTKRNNELPPYIYIHLANVHLLLCPRAWKNGQVFDIFLYVTRVGASMDCWGVGGGYWFRRQTLLHQRKDVYWVPQMTLLTDGSQNGVILPQCNSWTKESGNPTNNQALCHKGFYRW